MSVVATRSAGTPKDGRQSRWDAHNRRRRQDIIDAALEVVESGEPGAEFHVQQIAERAGLNRSVVYRHFADRADLDRAIQVQIGAGLSARLLPEVNLDGTVDEIIGRIVATYVTWVVEHPSLYAFVGTGGGADEGVAAVAETLVVVLGAAIDLLGVELGDDELASVPPLAHGLVGAVLGAVRRWVAQGAEEPAAERLAQLLADSVWYLLDGHARRLGLDIDPHLSLEQLLRAAETA